MGTSTSLGKRLDGEYSDLEAGQLEQLSCTPRGVGACSGLLGRNGLWGNRARGVNGLVAVCLRTAWSRVICRRDATRVKSIFFAPVFAPGATRPKASEVKLDEATGRWLAGRCGCGEP